MWGMVAGLAANVGSDLINKLMQGDKMKQVGESTSRQIDAGTTAATALQGMLPGVMRDASWNSAGLDGAAAQQDARLWQQRAGNVFGSTQRASNALQNLGGQMSSNVFAQNANASKIAGQSLGNMRTDAFGALNNVGSSPASIAASLGKLGEGNMAGANNLFQSTAQAAQSALQGRSQNEGQAANIMDQGRNVYQDVMIKPHWQQKENVAGLFGTLGGAQGNGMSASKDSLVMGTDGFRTTQAGLGKMGSEFMNTGMQDIFTNKGKVPLPTGTGV